MEILQAKLQDAHVAMSLLYEAMDDIALFLTGTKNKQTAVEELEKFFLNYGRLHYKNIHLVKKEGKIVAAMCAYGGADAKKLDAPIIAHLQKLGNDITQLDRECFADEFYVDSLTVDKQHRKQGIAQALFEQAENLASKAGYKKLALIVDAKKPTTKKYYERLGFVCDTNLTVNNHLFYHMIKQLD